MMGMITTMIMMMMMITMMMMVMTAMMTLMMLLFWHSISTREGFLPMIVASTSQLQSTGSPTTKKIALEPRLL